MSCGNGGYSSETGGDNRMPGGGGNGNGGYNSDVAPSRGTSFVTTGRSGGGYESEQKHEYDISPDSSQDGGDSPSKPHQQQKHEQQVQASSSHTAESHTAEALDPSLPDGTEFFLDGELWNIYESEGYPYYLRARDSHSAWEDPRLDGLVVEGGYEEQQYQGHDDQQYAATNQQHDQHHQHHQQATTKYAGVGASFISIKPNLVSHGLQARNGNNNNNVGSTSFNNNEGGGGEMKMGQVQQQHHHPHHPKEEEDKFSHNPPPLSAVLAPANLDYYSKSDSSSKTSSKKVPKLDLSALSGMLAQRATPPPPQAVAEVKASPGVKLVGGKDEGKAGYRVEDDTTTAAADDDEAIQSLALKKAPQKTEPKSGKTKSPKIEPEVIPTIQQLKAVPELLKFVKMSSVGVPPPSVVQKMISDNIGGDLIRLFELHYGIATPLGDDEDDDEDDEPEEEEIVETKEVLMRNEPSLVKYLKMTKMGVPPQNASNKMMQDSIDPEKQYLFNRTFDL
jgi:hypothetical protein